jgi:dolichyl-phosphate-mannose--protein O-mannosyl transferase
MTGSSSKLKANGTGKESQKNPTPEAKKMQKLFYTRFLVSIGCLDGTSYVGLFTPAGIAVSWLAEVWLMQKECLGLTIG